MIIDSGLHPNLRAGAELVLGEGAVFAELEFGTAAQVKTTYPFKTDKLQLLEDSKT